MNTLHAPSDYVLDISKFHLLGAYGTNLNHPTGVKPIDEISHIEVADEIRFPRIPAMYIVENMGMRVHVPNLINIYIIFTFYTSRVKKFRNNVSYDLIYVKHVFQISVFMTRKSISLMFLLIVIALTPVSTSNATMYETCDFLTLTINPETISAPGMSTNILVSMDETCSKAAYILVVIPPDAKDVIEDIVQEIKDADLKFLTFCTQVKSILQKYQGQTTIWYRSGYINSGETDDHNFPNDD